MGVPVELTSSSSEKGSLTVALSISPMASAALTGPAVLMMVASWVSSRSRSSTHESTLLDTSWATLCTPSEVAVVRLPSAMLASTKIIDPITTTEIARTPATKRVK